MASTGKSVKHKSKPSVIETFKVKQENTVKIT